MAPQERHLDDNGVFSGGEVMSAKLDDGHWVYPDYKQRIATKDWKELLLDDNDKIVFRGRLTQIKARRLGAGVVEISKEHGEES